MDRNMFCQYANDLKRLGATGVGASEFLLGNDGRYQLQYIPFEYVNRDARLVLVGITPGNTQLALAYGKAQELLRSGWSEAQILPEVKSAGAFGGPAMKPNLLKMLQHFQFDKILGIDDVSTLWAGNAGLLHSTSTVPHAAFNKAGKMFAGSFDEVMASPLLKKCFLDCFVPSAEEMNIDVLFVGLGPCPQAALEWCVQKGVLTRQQVLGSFCHPARSGGSAVKYYLREVQKDDLAPADPVRNRTEWLDKAYEQMQAATRAIRNDLPPKSAKMTPSLKPTPSRELALPLAGVKTDRPSPAKRHGSAVPTNDEIQVILSEIERSGYKLAHFTTKVAEFRSPGDQIIYLIKTNSKLNNIYLMVHPRLRPADLRLLEGVGSISEENRFHSNMTQFPKRLNQGQTETAYGWQVQIDTLQDLRKFLSDFSLKIS